MGGLALTTLAAVHATMRASEKRWSFQTPHPFACV